MKRPLSGRYLTGACLALLALICATSAMAGVVPRALYDKAAREGPVRVIVQFRVAAKPEKELGSAETMAAQRQAIAAVQSALTAELVGAGHRVIRTFETIPFLALEASSDALRILEASPLVVDVEEDRLELPQNPPDGPADVKPCVPAKPDSPPQQE
jgi:hypothetical protein